MTTENAAPLARYYNSREIGMAVFRNARIRQHRSR
jgi:hypothetical protein